MYFTLLLQHQVYNRVILIKYRPVYKVSISGEELGYIENIEAFEESLKQSLVGEETKNVDNIDISSDPEYELKLVNRTLMTNEEKVATELEENVVITYKYYEIAYKNEPLRSVNTIEEAEEVINKLKEEIKDQELDLSIIEKYTNNKEDINTSEVEIAKTEIQTILNEKIQEEEKQKEEEERINSLPSINGIKLAVTPVSGTITSRYGVSSRIRKQIILDQTLPQIRNRNKGSSRWYNNMCKFMKESYGNLVKIRSW